MVWRGDYWVEETLITENMTVNTLNRVCTVWRTASSLSEETRGNVTV